MTIAERINKINPTAGWMGEQHHFILLPSSNRHSQIVNRKSAGGFKRLQPSGHDPGADDHWVCGNHYLSSWSRLCRNRVVNEFAPSPNDQFFSVSGPEPRVGGNPSYDLLRYSYRYFAARAYSNLRYKKVAFFSVWS